MTETINRIAVAFLLLTSILYLPIAYSQSFNKKLDIEMHGRKVGVLDNVEFGMHDNATRTKIKATAKFEDFPTNMDEILGSKGNLLGRCTKRLYWRGNTSLGHHGQDLKLSSRLAYELWSCPSWLPSSARFKYMSDVRTVDWTLFIRPDNLADVKVSAHVRNVRGVPNWLEDLVGVHVTEHIAMKIPELCGACNCSDLTGTMRPKLESVQFDVDNRTTLFIYAEFSTNKNITPLLTCVL